MNSRCTELERKETGYHENERCRMCMGLCMYVGLYLYGRIKGKCEALVDVRLDQLEQKIVGIVETGINNIIVRRVYR